MVLSRTCLFKNFAASRLEHMAIHKHQLPVYNVCFCSGFLLETILYRELNTVQKQANSLPVTSCCTLSQPSSLSWNTWNILSVLCRAVLGVNWGWRWVTGCFKLVLLSVHWKDANANVVIKNDRDVICPQVCIRCHYVFWPECFLLLLSNPKHCI